jgi:hypothetical protein
MAKKDRLSEDGVRPTLARIFLKALVIAVVMWLIQRIGNS